MIQVQQQTTERLENRVRDIEILGGSIFLRGPARRNKCPWKGLPRATREARATEPGRGRNLRRSVPAGLLRDPQPEARGKNCGWRRKSCIENALGTCTYVEARAIGTSFLSGEMIQARSLRCEPLRQRQTTTLLSIVASHSLTATRVSYACVVLYRDCGSAGLLHSMLALVTAYQGLDYVFTTCILVVLSPQNKPYQYV